jgi:hypothetical protein
MPRLFRALTLALTLATPAAAQIYGVEDDICRIQVIISGVGANAQWRYDIDPRQSADWVRSWRARDQRLMAQIAGTYHSEVVMQHNGQTYVQRQTTTYDATGSFGFRDQLCSTGPYSICTPNEGYGRWAANPQANGTFFIARNYTDTNRLNACTGFFARLGPNGALIDVQNNTPMHRVSR